MFIDPDNGFEPKGSCGEMHVGYRDIAQVLTQLNENSIVSVFHHFRRISFPDDYAHIKAGLNGTFHGNLLALADVRYHCAFGWAIGAVVTANKRYAETRPVKIIT